MTRQEDSHRLSGCFVPLPTLFMEDSLDLNLPGMKRLVQFVLEGGVRRDNGVLLVGGGAGEFTAMSIDERIQLAQCVVAEAGDKVDVIVGAQGTNVREILRLVREVSRAGAFAVQVAPPFYHGHTDDDVLEFLAEVGRSGNVALVYYATYWTGFHSSTRFLDRLAELPRAVGLKWAAPHQSTFERIVRKYADRFCVIDNQLEFVQSHMLGGRGINVHAANYWPAWGVKLWNLLESRDYLTAQQEISKVLMPYYDLCGPISEFTGGEGHLDKLCLELIGLDSSRCRPPIRDIRGQFRGAVRSMMLECGIPGVR